MGDARVWDAFISHAWEDKEAFARPLAKALEEKGLCVWFDEFTLHVGDSLRRSIDYGLANSKYGIVILSPNFFAKEWPQKELDGLAAKEVSGEKVILPVWHNVTAGQVRKYSPTLADRVAVSSERGLEYIVGELLSVIKPGSRPMRPSYMPSRRPSAKPREPANWKKWVTIALGIGVLIALGTCIALGLWLVPNAANFLSAWLFVTPTSSLTYVPAPTATDTPPNTLTSTPVPSADTFTPEPPTNILTPTPAPISAIVTAEALNLRLGPGTEYDIVGKLAQGDVATVIGRNPGGDWLKVEHEGETGWVARGYVEVPEVAMVPIAEVPPTPTSTLSPEPAATPTPTQTPSPTTPAPTLALTDTPYPTYTPLPTDTPTLPPPLPPTPIIVDKMDSISGWNTYKDDKGSSIEIESTSGKTNNAVKISFSLKEYGWVSIAKSLYPTGLLDGTRAMKFSYKGSGASNTIELKLIYGPDAQKKEAVFSILRNGVTDTGDWTVLEVSYAEFVCWPETGCDVGERLDVSRVQKIDFAISNKSDRGDIPGTGAVFLDDVQAVK